MHLQQRLKGSRNLLLNKRKGRNLRVCFFDMSKIECYTCHKFGHYARDCKQNKKKPKRRFQACAEEVEEEEDEELKKK